MNSVEEATDKLDIETHAGKIRRVGERVTTEVLCDCHLRGAEVTNTLELVTCPKCIVLFLFSLG